MCHTRINGLDRRSKREMPRAYREEVPNGLWAAVGFVGGASLASAIGAALHYRAIAASPLSTMRFRFPTDKVGNYVEQKGLFNDKGEFNETSDRFVAEKKTERWLAKARVGARQMAAEEARTADEYPQV